MKNAVIFMIASLAVAVSVEAQNYQFSSGTFPQALFECILSGFPQVSKQNYVGSGQACTDFKSGKAQFAENDVEPNSLKGDLSCHPSFSFVKIQAPGTAIVPIYNDPGCKSKTLKMARATLCGIFKGTIKTWDKVPGCENVKKPIKVCVRCDSSGTTVSFTRTLSCMCPGSWNACSAPGGGKNYKTGAKCVSDAGTNCKWAKGFLAGDGNSEVGQCVKDNVGAVGYVSYANFLIYKSPVKAFSVQAKNNGYSLPLIKNIKIGLNSIGSGSTCYASKGWPIIVFPWTMFRTKNTPSSIVPGLKQICTRIIDGKSGSGKNCVVAPFFQLAKSAKLAYKKVCNKIA